MSPEDLRRTRAAIASAEARAARLEQTMSELVRRTLWVVKIFLGGVLLTLLKLCSYKGGAPGL